MVLDWGYATDVGVLRAHNEDALLAEPPLFIVADGMGGHAAGEVASALLVETFLPLVSAERLTSDDVTAALIHANTRIVSQAAGDRAKVGMGTTVVGLVALQQGSSDYWLAFNLGDSRLYRFANGQLKQITVDHSYVQELVDAGRLTPAGARSHPERSVVTRVVGAEIAQGADYWLFPPQVGERLMLCSDGLSSELDDAEIGSLLARRDDATTVSEALVAAALAVGGRDNVTVIVVDVTAVEGEGDGLDLDATQPALDRVDPAGIDEDTVDPGRLRAAESSPGDSHE